jgi:hypothetical protein
MSNRLARFTASTRLDDVEGTDDLDVERETEDLEVERPDDEDDSVIFDELAAIIPLISCRLEDDVFV